MPEVAPPPGAPATAASAPAPTRSWLAAQGRLPLAFVGVSLGWLAAATVLLVSDATILALPHSHPQVVALTHAWVLGALVTAALGAMYQIAPIALGTTLVNERHAWWHLALHAVGVPGMVHAFFQWDLPALGHFGTLVALGVVLFAVEMGRVLRRARRRGLVAWSLGLAAGWLLLTVLLGLLLAANRFWHFLPLDPLPLLRMHAHLGLVGFFVTLLQGVSFQLVPMFTLAEVKDWTRPTRAMWLGQIGLVGLVPALLLQNSLAQVVAAGLIGVGWIETVVALRQSLATRRKRHLEPGVRTFMIALSLGVAAVLAGLLLTLPTETSRSAPGGFSATPYGVLVVFGVLVPAITGMLCKIVPFLTWMRAYGPGVGREPTPAATDLGSARLQNLSFALQLVALALLFVGAWRLDSAWLRGGAGALAGGMALFLADMLVVLSHLWKPRLRT